MPLRILCFVCLQPEASSSSIVAMSELKLTKPAPNFQGTAVVNGDFKEISLADYRGKYLVFFFYPLDL
jgi:phage-related protein